MMWTALALTLGSMLAVTTAPSRAAAQELVAAAGAGAGGIGLPPAGAGLVPGTPGIPSAGAGVGPGTFGIPPAGAGIGNGNGGVTRPPGLVPPCCFLPAWVWIPGSWTWQGSMWVWVPGYWARAYHPYRPY